MGYIGRMDAPLTDLGYLERFCKGDRQRMERYIAMSAFFNRCSIVSVPGNRLMPMLAVHT